MLILLSSQSLISSQEPITLQSLISSREQLFAILYFFATLDLFAVFGLFARTALLHLFARTFSPVTNLYHFAYTRSLCHPWSLSKYSNSLPRRHHCSILLSSISSQGPLCQNSSSLLRWNSRSLPHRHPCFAIPHLLAGTAILHLHIFPILELFTILDLFARTYLFAIFDLFARTALRNSFLLRNP